MHRRSFIMLGASLLALPAYGQARITATLHKNPNCGCCDIYAGHMGENGFNVSLVNTTDLEAVRRGAGVPDELAGCHTMFVDGYITEGLIPAEIVLRLLKERPAITGIALPGMPTGVPGMPGPKPAPLPVYAFGPDGIVVYAEA